MIKAETRGSDLTRGGQLRGGGYRDSSIVEWRFEIAADLSLDAQGGGWWSGGNEALSGAGIWFEGDFAG